MILETENPIFLTDGMNSCCESYVNMSFRIGNLLFDFEIIV